MGRERRAQGRPCPALATRMARDDAYGVYFIFKSMEQGPSFRISVPKYATKDPNYRILARQRSRFTHYYFYLRDETLGPMVMVTLRGGLRRAIPFLLSVKRRARSVPGFDAAVWRAPPGPSRYMS